MENMPVRMTRHGFEEDTWFTFCYSPVATEDGRVEGMFCACSETTGHVQAEERLLRKEAELREVNSTLEQQVQEQTAQLQLSQHIIESAADLICAFDKDYRVIAFNRSHSDELFRIFAYRVQVGDVFRDLFPPDQSPIIRAFMARALAGEVFTVIEAFGDPDLAKPYWEVSYSPLRDSEGRDFGALHYARDISARLRVKNELAVTQEALRQLQKKWRR